MIICVSFARYNMVFVPFTGVDNHWKNVTFGASLIAKEDYKNFKWLINTFKRAMGHAPTCVITDQCPAIKKALQLNWPHTKHRLCMWHIMNKLPSKVWICMYYSYLIYSIIPITCCIVTSFYLLLIPDWH